MALSAGTRLGPYEVTSLLGAGGMGEVYKARDTRLDRVVALKVSNSEFGERFEREARAVGALNHPHICRLYDVGPNYLVMELIEGVPLQGPLALDKAVEYAIQIAGALDHAHRAGVIHRDLKPANILVTRDGAKVLDFGLAKLAPKPVDLSDDFATQTIGLTQEGAIVGTLKYMSPEQIEGKETDPRSDIFSFGALLYEMLSGRRAFDGQSAAGILAAVLKDQPPLTAEWAGPLEPVVRRCLAKDPDDRFQTARDLKWALESSRGAPEPDSAPPVRSRWWLRYAGWAVAAISGAVAIAAWAWRQPASESPMLRVTISAPAETRFANTYFATAVSPDGRLLVFGAARDGAVGATLWLRPMDSLLARELPGTEGGNGAFWSPDSKSIGFVANNQLKRIDVLGGTPQVLCDAANFEGGSWNAEGVIVFSANNVIQRISGGGGSPAPLTSLDASRQEIAHRYPQFLPGGKNFLFTVTSTDRNSQGIHVTSLSDPRQRIRLVESDAKALYAPPRDGRPGQLLWIRDQTLVAQRFDGTSRVEGEPIPVADNIATGSLFGSRRASYWISDTGLLLYRSGGSAGFQLDWFGRDGKSQPLSGAGADPSLRDPSLSPDGARAAISRKTSAGGGFDVWVYEFARGVLTRLTFDPGNDTNAVWSPTGRQIAFSSDRGGVPQIYRKDAGGAGSEERLTDGPNPKVPLDWSGDGRFILYEQQDAKTGWDLWALPIEGNRKPVPVLQTQFNEHVAQFSPDGKWISYVSNESVPEQVYIQPFPPTGAKWQVSTDGGSGPRWRGDGKEIYYERGGRLWAAGIRVDASQLVAGVPHIIFPVSFLNGADYFYDVTRDGQRFLAVQPVGAVDQPAGALIVVSNWQAGLKQ